MIILEWTDITLCLEKYMCKSGTHFIKEDEALQIFFVIPWYRVVTIIRNLVICVFKKRVVHTDLNYHRRLMITLNEYR